MFKALIMGLLLAAQGVMAATAAMAAVSDPTRPPATVARAADAGPVAAASWRLESVIMTAGSRRAVINGQPVREGDSLGAGQVLAIDAGGVWIRVEGERRRLQMHRGLDKNWINRDRN